MTENKRAFPDILAVDPRGCGCNECSFYEYVPFERFIASANAYDLEAFASGEISNNTYERSTLHVILNTSWDTESATEWVEQFILKLSEDLPSLNLPTIDW
jgi:hypothetical protein